MGAQVNSVPSQTEGIRKTFFEWASIYYPLNYLLHVDVMLTVIKVFIILVLLVGIGNALAIFKANQ